MSESFRRRQWTNELVGLRADSSRLGSKASSFLCVFVLDLEFYSAHHDIWDPSMGPLFSVKSKAGSLVPDAPGLVQVTSTSTQMPGTVIAAEVNRMSKLCGSIALVSNSFRRPHTYWLGSKMRDAELVVV